MSLNRPSNLKTESNTSTLIYYRLMIFPVLNNFQHITLIFLHVFWCGQVCTHYTLKRVAFIQPKIPEILAGTSN